MPLIDDIKEAAQSFGFVLAGFAPLKNLSRREFFNQWLDGERHGEMAYMSRQPERRFDPKLLDPRLRSVISLAYPYPAPPVTPSNAGWQASLRGRIAAYALGPDYHDRVLAAAGNLATVLAGMRPGCRTRLYVDTGPVLEREWAREAGLGWFGKNTNLLNRRQGSYFFLAEIFTDLDLPAPAAPYRDHCGRCRRCLDLCPTGALEDGYLLDARLCISYLTIELRGAIAPAIRSRIDNWIFGCDVCQEVCPWNDQGPAEVSELTPYLPELLALDEEGFRARFARTAIKRTKRRGLARNVAIALGNSGNPAAVDPLARAMAGDPEPLVRGHAAWALGQIGGRDARRALELGEQSEREPTVRTEIEAASRAFG